MIRETALMLTDPFLIAREMAEDAFDHRFKEAVLDCEYCDGLGWVGDDPHFKCGDCQDGEIYTALCIRCQKDENGCKCAVNDFM